MAKEQKAVFAGGCFWCMEKPFEKIEGVKSVVSGYTGGHVQKPTYKQVSSGKTGHIEAVEITYEDTKVSYAKLLYVFWQQINPTDDGGQFVDRGKQYSPAIFFLSPEQQKQAKASMKVLKETKIFPKELKTALIKAGKFYTAEKYHQDYYKKNPIRYWYYRNGSGRDQYLDKIWNEKKRQNFLSKMQKSFPDSIGLKLKMTDTKQKKPMH